MGLHARIQWEALLAAKSGTIGPALYWMVDFDSVVTWLSGGGSAARKLRGECQLECLLHRRDPEGRMAHLAGKVVLAETLLKCLEPSPRVPRLRLSCHLRAAA